MTINRTVYGTVLKPDGTVYTDWALTFRLVSDIISDGAVIPSYSVEIITDSSGNFITELVVPTNGTAHYIVKFKNLIVYEFNLSAGSSIGLNEIISIATVAVDPNYITELTSLDITSVDDDYAVLASDDYIRCNGTFDVTLPATAGHGDKYMVKNVGDGVITPVVTGSDTINGTTPVSIAAGECVMFIDYSVGDWDSIVLGG